MAASDDFRRVAYWLHGTCLGLRLAAVVVFTLLLPRPFLARIAAVSALLYVVNLWMARRGSWNLAILSLGADWSLYCLATVLTLGPGTSVHLFALLLPITVLLYVHLPLRWRVVLAVAPLVLFPVLRLGIGQPLALDPAPPGWIDGLSVFSHIMFVALLLLIFVHTLARVERARAHAEALAGAKARLVADMGHELRTPVAALLTTLQATLRRERSDEEYRAALGTSERITRDFGRLVDDMLDLADLERPDLEPRNEDLELRDVVRGLTERLDPVARAHGVTIEVHGTARSHSDPWLLDRILGNLLSNAVRYSPPGETVRIDLERVGDRARVTVTDRGPGIPPEQVERIFERYSRGDPARRRSGGHAGLGLAIAAAAAERLGGRLEVRSEVGRGTEMALVL